VKPNIVPYDNVVAVLPVTVPYEKKSEKSPHWLIGKALSTLLAGANLEKADIDGLALASYTLVPDSAAVMADYFKTEFNWVLDMPMGGVSGVIGLKRAARAVQVGDAEIIACIGADAMAKKANFKTLIRNFSTFSRDHTYQYGAAGPSSLFAMKTSHYMDKFGAKREDFGRICIAQREAAMDNPLAMLRKPLSMEEYLSAMKLSDPLRLYDCVMPCSGAEGFLVMSADRALSLGLKGVKISSAIESHNAYQDDEIQFRSGWAKYSDDMYDAAGLGSAGL
jgi:acetyl-CoA acetyltransferase